MVKHTFKSMMAERDALQVRLDQAQKAAERWHKIAMDAGVISHTDGSTSHPMRAERDLLAKTVADLQLHNELTRQNWGTAESRKQSAMAERDALKARVAELEGALKTSVAMLTELEQFHDNHKTKPCNSYDAECPIAMGEWFDKADRSALASARAALSRARDMGIEP